MTHWHTPTQFSLTYESTMTKRKIKNTTLSLHMQRIGTKGGCVTRKKHGSAHYRKAVNKRWAKYRAEKRLKEGTTHNEKDTQPVQG